MQETNEDEYMGLPIPQPKSKGKRPYKHLAVRPKVMEIFRRFQKDYGYTDNGFVVELLRVYKRSKAQ